MRSWAQPPMIGWAGAALGALAGAAWLEHRLRRPAPPEAGFWSLARTVDGECHMRWGPGQTPVVRFALPGGDARARAVPLGAASGGWGCEVRARFENPLAGALVVRVSWPPAAPWRFRTPGMVAGAPWRGASVDHTDAGLWRAWSAVPDVAEAIAAPGASLGEAAALEWVVAPGLVTLRAWMPGARLTAGAAVEQLGPALVDALRALARNPPTFAKPPEASTSCGFCAQPAPVDRARCRRCGGTQHRGCRVHTVGCVAIDCAGAVDAPPSLARAQGPSAQPR
jgi:hypothetical protein